MSFVSISMCETDLNIERIKRMAKSKDYKMKKVRNQDCYDLQDTQSGKIIMRNRTPMEIHQFLCKSDD